MTYLLFCLMGQIKNFLRAGTMPYSSGVSNTELISNLQCPSSTRRFTAESLRYSNVKVSILMPGAGFEWHS